MNPNMIPLSLAREAANNRTTSTNRNRQLEFRSWFRGDASTSSATAGNLPEEHPALRGKNHRLGFRLFKSHAQSPELQPSSRNTEPTVPALTHHRANEESSLLPASEETHRSVNQRRNGVRSERPRQAWIRRPRRKYGYFDTGDISYRTIIKNKNVRSSMITCGVSGFLLLAVLGIYLGLLMSLNNTVEGQEFHILLILLIMIFTILFCHSLARTCMHVTRTARGAGRVPTRVGPTGYAQPEQPIPVVLARDEEIASEPETTIQAEKVVAPPPAYGLWRSSVRINPDLLYWQRVEQRARKVSAASGEEQSVTTVRRPPSYASDDGVDYVIDARPRSMAPTRALPSLSEQASRT